MKILHTSISLAILALTLGIQAQTWKELNPPPNIFSDNISSVVSDNQDHLYAAGSFKNTANEYVVATWNGSGWKELGAGGSPLRATNTINCLSIDRQNNLYAAGGFTNSTGNYSIAKWNGSRWSELDSGANALNPNQPIYAMAVDSSGNLYVAGGFTNTAGKYFVAKWNGVTWSELGALNGNSLIESLAADKNNVYAGGAFTNANGERYVAKWDGTTWTELGALYANDIIRTVTVDHNNNVYAAGDFRNSSNEHIVAKWDGNSWSELGSLKANGPINVIAANMQNHLFAGGFETDAVGLTKVDEWDGTTWTEVFSVGYTSDNAVRGICFDKSNNVYAAGDFKNGGNHNYVGIWNGSVFKELGRQGEFLPVHNGVSAIITDIHGYAYAIGDFYPSGGATADIAKWNGIGWTQMQSADLFHAIQWPTTIAADKLGNIYTAGRSINAGGEYYVAKWDGTDWIELSSTTRPLHGIDHITSLAVDKNNNVYAVGLFQDQNNVLYTIAKWDGTGWDESVSLPQNNLSALTIDPSSQLYVVMTFGNSQPDQVLKVQGNTLVPVGSGTAALNPPDFVYSLLSDQQGNLYASGRYNYVSKWNGTSWNVVGAPFDVSTIAGMTIDASGNVYAAADDANNLNVSKWDGATWAPLGGRYSLNVGGAFGAITSDLAGDIYAGGNFSHIAVYGNAALMLPQPVITVPGEYCSTAGMQSIKILNPPAPPFTSISVKLDNMPLSVNVDSTLHINPSAMSAGAHQLKITYSSFSDTVFDVKNFSITVPVTPDVNLSASTTTVTTSDPVIVTASNVAGGGASPLYTFARDRNFTTLLQAESLNNVLSLDPTSLSNGENRIYVKMRTSDSCYIKSTAIDSISVNTTSVATGITDVDFPNEPINVYPNPFATSVTLRGLQQSKSYVISMYSSSGQLTYKQDVRNRTNVTITGSFPQGIYWLSILDNSKHKILGSLALIHEQ